MQELLEAIEHDSLPRVRKLLESQKYDLNSNVIIGAEYDLEDYDEIPLLFFLVQKQASSEMIELLLNHGMDINLRSREGLGVVDIAIKYRRKDVVELAKKRGVDITTSKRKSGLTPLMLAASFNDIEMMEYLLQNGAAIDNRDNYGMSAFDYAKKMGQKKAASFLESLQEKK